MTCKRIQATFSTLVCSYSVPVLFIYLFIYFLSQFPSPFVSSGLSSGLRDTWIWIVCGGNMNEECLFRLGSNSDSWVPDETHAGAGCWGDNTRVLPVAYSPGAGVVILASLCLSDELGKSDRWMCTSICATSTRSRKFQKLKWQPAKIMKAYGCFSKCVLYLQPLHSAKWHNPFRILLT